VNVPTDTLFVDVSGWSAYLDEHDPHHAEAVEKIQKNEDQLLTSDYVLSELGQSAHTRIDKRQLSSLIWRFCGIQENKLLRVSEDEELEAWHVYQKHSGPLPSFVDCTSLVVLNKHKINRWLSFSNWLPKTPNDISTYVNRISLDSEENTSSS
jgi:predicted nucleic acid-binding protein